MPRAMMGGRPIVNRQCQHSLLIGVLIGTGSNFIFQVITFHASTASGYVAALRQYGSQWIIGYGSAIAALAESCFGRRSSRLSSCVR